MGVSVVVLLYVAVVLAQVRHSDLLTFSKLVPTPEFGHELDLHGNVRGCWKEERCMAPPWPECYPVAVSAAVVLRDVMLQSLQAQPCAIL